MYRRRIKPEEKAKVVGPVGGGGGEFIQLLAALAIYDDLKNRTNSAFYFISSWHKLPTQIIQFQTVTVERQ